MKKNRMGGIALMLAICLSIMIAPTAAEEAKPFYVLDKLDEYTSETVDLYSEKLDTTVETDPDALEYLLYESKNMIVQYDNQKRFAIVSDKGMFLGTKNGDQAVIQCCLKTDALPYEEITEDHNVGIDFGGKLLFANYNLNNWQKVVPYTVMLLDWDDLAIYKVADAACFYGSSGGKYLVFLYQDKAYIFDKSTGICKSVTIPYNGKLTRLTDAGGIITAGSDYLFLSLEDAAVYTTSLTGTIYMAADDYYIKEDEYAVNAYLADGSKESLIKKTEMEAFKKSDFFYGSAGNVVWFGAPYYGGRTYVMDDNWSEGNEVFKATCWYSNENTLFPRVSFSEGIFNTWYITRTGSDIYEFEKDKAFSLMNHYTYEYTENDDGYLGTYNDYGSQFEYITKRSGYYRFLYDENILETYTVTFSPNPDPEAVKNAL